MTINANLWARVSSTYSPLSTEETSLTSTAEVQLLQSPPISQSPPHRQPPLDPAQIETLQTTECTVPTPKAPEQIGDNPEEIASKKWAEELGLKYRIIGLIDNFENDLKVLSELKDAIHRLYDGTNIKVLSDNAEVQKIINLISENKDNYPAEAWLTVIESKISAFTSKKQVEELETLLKDGSDASDSKKKIERLVHDLTQTHTGRDSLRKTISGLLLTDHESGLKSDLLGDKYFSKKILEKKPPATVDSRQEGKNPTIINPNPSTQAPSTDEVPTTQTPTLTTPNPPPIGENRYVSYPIPSNNATEASEKFLKDKLELFSKLNATDLLIHIENVCLLNTEDLPADLDSIEEFEIGENDQLIATHIVVDGNYQETELHYKTNEEIIKAMLLVLTEYLESKNENKIIRLLHSNLENLLNKTEPVAAIDLLAIWFFYELFK